jgi:hypothetical protein
MPYSKKEKQKAIKAINKAINSTDLKIGYVFLDENI